MAEAQCSVMRLMNELQDRQDKDDPTDFTQVKDVQEFFFKMQLLMWNLKPIATDMERKLQDLGRDYVGYDVSGK
jgi:hypothetical protein